MFKTDSSTLSMYFRLLTVGGGGGGFLFVHTPHTLTHSCVTSQFVENVNKDSTECTDTVLA